MSESSFRLSLSAKDLQRVEKVSHENDFAFSVGEDRYSCPSFVAEFLSPRVSSLRAHDVTIDEFSIETEDPHHSFGTLLSLGFGREVSLSQEDVSFVRSGCGELWNSELFEKTLKPSEGDIPTEELRARLDFVSGIDLSCDSDLTVIASHLSDFSTSDFDGVSSALLQAIVSDSALVLPDEDFLFDIVHRRASEDLSYFGLLECVRFEFLSDERLNTALEFISCSFDLLTFGIWSSLRSRLSLQVTPAWPPGRFFLPPMDSTILSRTPRLFSMFRWKEFRLLYRGSRDGFEAAAFHSRCKGHPNTITVVFTTNGCIFGGYTPLTWSSQGAYPSDPTLGSFIFTIKNPHNLPAQLFRQKQGAQAIGDHGSYGPTFGYGCDFHVCDKCQNSNNSYSNLGITYANETGIEGKQVLTGAYNFTAKEIEVFEVVSRL
jgi:hypothetical protein